VRSHRSASMIWLAILIAAFQPFGLAKTAKRKAPHPTTDMVTQTFKQNCVPVSITNVALDGPSDKPTDPIDPTTLSAFILRPEFPWGKTGLEELFPDPSLKEKFVPQKGTAYVIHVTVWKKNPVEGGDPLVLDSSNWYAYRRTQVSGTAGLKQWYTSTSTGDLPLVYGAKAVELIGIQRVVVEKADDATKLQIAYEVTPSQGTPENQANIARVFSGFFGLQSGTAKGGNTDLAPSKDDKNACAERFSIQGTSFLPYDLSVKFSYTVQKSDPKNTARKNDDVPPLEHPEAASAGPKVNDSGLIGYQAGTAAEAATQEAPPTAGAPQAGGPPPGGKPANKADAAGNGNTVNRTIHVLDKEWWDLSLSLSIPGVREPKVSLNKDNLVTPSVTRHVDMYGFVSLYPFAAKRPKNSFAPHFDVGLPFSGQPLHRWFAGASEKIPLIEKTVGIPVNVFAGTVFLRESLSTLAAGTKAPDAATFTNSLQAHWVRKGMFGLEFPVSALVGKLGKK